MKALMTLQEAAAETPHSTSFLRRAIHATDPQSYPPPLLAKRGSRGEFHITDKALREWIESLPDA